MIFVQNKEQIKQYIKIAMIRIFGMAIPVSFLFFYLIFTGAFNEFINYAILGIKTFSNKREYIRLLKNENLDINILSILVPIYLLVSLLFIFVKIIKKEKEKVEDIISIFLYSISIIIVMYPIADSIHFLIGSIISIIGIIYYIFLFGKDIYLKMNLKNKYLIYKISTLIIFLVMFSIISTFGIKNWYTYINQDKNTEIAHFKYIEMTEKVSKRTINICEYITKSEKDGKEVYILDVEAAIYMIPLNKYNKNYDMFLKGNLGKNGEDGEIEKIKNKNENTILLIRKENIINNWQTPMKVVNYIRNNLTKIDEVELYDCYK